MHGLGTVVLLGDALRRPFAPPTHSHPIITQRVPEGLEPARQAATADREAMEGLISRWVAEIGIRGLRAEQVWNCDEFGFSSAGPVPRVLARRGARTVTAPTTGTMPHLTVVSFINAADGRSRQVYILKARNAGDLIVTSTYILGFSESGWTSNDLHRRIMDEWSRELTGQHLLLCDGHSSHYTHDVLSLLQARNVRTFVLPPHTTHLLQPLDVGVFGPFRRAVNRAFAGETASGLGQERIVELLEAATQQAFTAHNILGAFRHPGKPSHSLAALPGMPCRASLSSPYPAALGPRGCRIPSPECSQDASGWPGFAFRDEESCGWLLGFFSGASRCARALASECATTASDMPSGQPPCSASIQHADWDGSEARDGGRRGAGATDVLVVCAAAAPVPAGGPSSADPPPAPPWPRRGRGDCWGCGGGHSTA